MKKVIIVISAFLLSNMVQAQVKFNLSYQEATKVYTLSVIPDVTWEAPNSMVSSAQIVLRVDADIEFIPGITSLVDGLLWADNAYVERPDGALDYTFVCISLVNGPTAKIDMVAGQEVPLFSFVNAGGGCAGKLVLLANDDPMTQSVRSAGFNVTQHFATLGARGNAFGGIVNSEADCSEASGSIEPHVKIIEDVKISPIPADEELSIQWTLISDQQSALRQMIICDDQGREVFREQISDAKGQHALQIKVEHWPAGMYRMRFSLGNSQRTQSWNLMVIH